MASRLRGISETALKEEKDRAVDFLRKKNSSKELIDHNIDLFCRLGATLNHMSFQEKLGSRPMSLLRLALYHNLWSAKSLPSEVKSDISDSLEQFIELKEVDLSKKDKWDYYSSMISTNLPLLMFRTMDISLLPLERDLLIKVFGYDKNKIEQQIHNIAESQLLVYGSVAEILGLNNLSMRLKDISTGVLYPNLYNSVVTVFDQNTNRMIQAEQEFGAKLAEVARESAVLYGASFIDIGDKSCCIKGRMKSKGSITLKLLARDMKVDEIMQLHDLLAFTVVAENPESAEVFLEHLRQKFEIQDKDVDNFMDKPRPNGYRAIHVDVPYNGFSIEVQIKLKDMYERCEGGDLAHALYKQSKIERAHLRELTKYGTVLRDANTKDIETLAQIMHNPRSQVRIKVNNLRRTVDLPQNACVFDLLALSVPSPTEYVVRSTVHAEKSYSLFDLVRPELEYELVKNGQSLSKQTLKQLIPVCTSTEARVVLSKLLHGDDKPKK